MKPYPPEVKERARELRGEGLSCKRIAREMQLPHATIARWVDPRAAERSRQLARRLKQRYRGTCRECGRSTSGCFGPGKAPDYCAACAPLAHSYWTKERIIVAIQAWAAVHGRPPRAHADWTKSGDTHPAFSHVQHRFGSWAEGLAAAGFRVPPGGYLRTPETLAKQSASLRQYSDADLLEAIRVFVRTHGRVPTIADTKSRNGLPHANTYVRRFGTWTQAIRLAGFTPSRGGPKPRNLHRDLEGI